MKHKTYLQAVNSTENKDFAGMSERLQDPKVVRLLHAAMGLSTEANELLDNLKKHIFYGKSIDQLNLFEELGDISYYQAVMIDELDTTLEDVMQANANKLRVRYGAKFSEQAAVSRDIEAELKAIEEQGNE